MQLRSESIPGIPRTRDTERSMINATTREEAFGKRVLKRVLKRVYTAKVIYDTRLSQKHVYVEMINTKLFWNAFTMCPRKKNLETMDKSCGMCYYYHIYFMKSWLIYFRMIHNWNSSNHASLSSIVFTKLNVKSHFCATFRYMYTCRQGNCYNRSPMWPSLGFKPFSTKKLHGFIYMMILDNHLNNSLSFSSGVASHHHWHKSTV